MSPACLCWAPHLVWVIPPRLGEHREKQDQVVSRSVIKVHTDRGVIVLPGRADTWDSVERAEFVADSLADLQMVNNEVSIYSVSMN